MRPLALRRLGTGSRALVCALCLANNQKDFNTHTIQNIAQRQISKHLLLEQKNAMQTALNDVALLINNTHPDKYPHQPPMNLQRNHEQKPTSLLPAKKMDEILAPRLPLLMMPNFISLAREHLANLRSPIEQQALFEINVYLLGVYEQIADDAVDLEWLQLNKLRELCDAAAEGGNEALIASAQAMREELDETFCNFLNEAIEKEEARLRASGIEPISQRSTWLPSIATKVADTSAGDVSSEMNQASPFLDVDVSGKASKIDVYHPGVDELVAQQQWLLVLRVVKQGVYSLLARDRLSDVEQIRYINNIVSREGRRDLTAAILNKMTQEERSSFEQTVKRVRDNLSIARNSLDVELHERVCEIHDYLNAEEK